MRDPVLQRKQVTLVVDDDEATRDALREVLMDAGYSVATAAGGRDAIEFLEQHPADAVVLDLMMNEIDGWGVAGYIKSRADLANLPIVVMTAHGVRALASAPVAAAYLTKPLSIDTLLGALRLVLTVRPPPGGDDGDAELAEHHRALRAPAVPSFPHRKRCRG